MAEHAITKAEKIEHPQTCYRSPDEILGDDTLTREEKARALDMWEQDARQMLTASNEGMPGSAEGTQRSDHSQLGQVERAKLKLGKKPRSKPAH